MNTKAELLISLIVFSYCEHWLHVLLWALTLAFPFKSLPNLELPEVRGHPGHAGGIAAMGYWLSHRVGSMTENEG